nr:MAG TPA: hypothetical protein [Caudoviricetes sp.]
MRAYSLIHTYTYTHTYTHTHTCTHTHIHTHAHTHIHVHTKLHNVYNTTLLPLAHHHSNVLHYARVCAPYVKELTKVMHFTLK